MSIDGGEVSVEITNDYGSYVDGTDEKRMNRRISGGADEKGNDENVSITGDKCDGKDMSVDTKDGKRSCSSNEMVNEGDVIHACDNNQLSIKNAVYAREQRIDTEPFNSVQSRTSINKENVLNTGGTKRIDSMSERKDEFMNVRMENVIEETKDKNLIDKERVEEVVRDVVMSDEMMGRGNNNGTDNGNNNGTDNESNNGNNNESNNAVQNNKDVLINTVDLRRIIRKDEEELNINERLASIGIRFLDDLILKQTRKSTLIKTKNEIDEHLYVYYKLYYEQRMAFFCSFLSYIKDKMKEHEQVLANKHKEMRVDDFMRMKNAKALKTECRNRTRIRWHELRRTREMNFNKRMVECRDELVEVNRGMEIERDRREKERQRVRDEIERLEVRMGDINRNSSVCRSGSAPSSTGNNLKDDNESVKSVNTYDFERMKRKIKEQNDLIECLSKEVQEKKKYNAILKQRIQNERKEEQTLRVTIREMEENARTKTVDEQECEQMKKRYLLSATFYQCEVLKIEKERIEFNFLQFGVVYGAKEVVVRATVKNEFINFYVKVVNERIGRGVARYDNEKGSNCNSGTDNNTDVLHPSFIINTLSLVSLYYEEILVMERKYFLDMVINDGVCLNVRVPSISSDERGVEMLIDKELMVYVKMDGKYVKSSSISLLDIVE